MSKCYSNNGEDYRDYIEHVYDGFSECNDPGDSVTYFEGDSVERSHSDYISPCDVVGLIEQMQCNASDDVSDISESYLSEFDSDDAKKLREIIIEFLDNNSNKPNFFAVKNIKEITGVWDGDEVI